MPKKTTPAPRSGPAPKRVPHDDQQILSAAREVFLADPQAPVSAVAGNAGVGMSALYRRFANKEDLLRRLCHDGLKEYIAVAEASDACADDWEAFTRFVYGIVDADVHALTVKLAGTFAPTAVMGADAARAAELGAALFKRGRRSGRLRSDAVFDDLTYLLEGAAAIRLPDADRTSQLRRRFTTMFLDALATTSPTKLPGPAPSNQELNWRWHQR